MPNSAKSLLDIDELLDNDLSSIFKRAKDFKARGFLRQIYSQKVLASCFFEPSTRTKISFEIAAARMGLRSVSLGDAGASSMAKGETELDSFLTVKAMRPDIIVVRFKENAELRQALGESEIPVVSAGEGSRHHPTQALLDAMTICETLGNLHGLKVLYSGDTLHSRVAHSGASLFKRLGAEVGFASPQNLVSKCFQPDAVFKSLAEGAPWADVVIGLRTQTERHGKADHSTATMFDFRLDAKNLSELKSKALIMHPGPCVPMVDFDPNLLNDPRCRVHQQVMNGVYIRAAVIETFIKEDQ